MQRSVTNRNKGSGYKDSSCVPLGAQRLIERFNDASRVLKRALLAWERATGVSLNAASVGWSQVDAFRDLGRAFSEIVRMQEFLSQLSTGQSKDLEDAAAEYRKALEQFKSKLPRIKGWLIVERGRLAGRQAHSASVQGWINAHGQTR